MQPRSLHMPSRILVLTGSPANSTLQWDAGILLDHFIDPVRRFAGSYEEIRVNGDASSLTTPNPRHAAWRVLQVAPERHLVTGYSQGVPVAPYEHDNYYERSADENNEATSFLTISDFSITSESGSVEDNVMDNPEKSTDEVLTQFYEHSLAVYGEPGSSQPVASGVVEEDIDKNDTSILHSDPSGHSFRQIPAAAFPPLTISITSLAQIPPASYLHSITPQTMTVSLVVGIITITPPRPISTRRGETVHLLELLVGDETKSGFTVNFWLPNFHASNNPWSESKKTAKDGAILQETLEQLRPQDVVLLQNVALLSFRGKVHGQSMRRAKTNSWLLYRNRFDRGDTGGCFRAEDLRNRADRNSIVERTSRVMEWVLRFVGGGVREQAVSGKGKRKVEVLEDLPPDTQ